MAHCGRFISRPMTRRQMLRACGMGVGAVAMEALLAQEGRAAEGARPPHFKTRAKNVIFLYMDGGVSQVDSFDPKPRLNAEHGQVFRMKMEPTQFNNNGKTLGCPWEFRPRGRSGMMVSELFPHIAQCADELAVVRSMTSNFSEHTTDRKST